ncbi:MAG TPA: hypothetical protein VGF96_13130 [Terracidiphilus sp.]
MEDRNCHVGGHRFPDNQRHTSALDVDKAQYQFVQYSLPPVPVMDTCYVNGVNCSVDYSYRIWDTNAAGLWVVIGRFITPYGPFALIFGQAYPAICE